jgi:hypothetical protein
VKALEPGGNGKAEADNAIKPLGLLLPWSESSVPGKGDKHRKGPDSNMLTARSLYCGTTAAQSEGIQESAGYCGAGRLLGIIY